MRFLKKIEVGLISSDWVYFQSEVALICDLTFYQHGMILAVFSTGAYFFSWMSGSLLF